MSPLHYIEDHPGTDRGIRLWVKRDDLVHPTIQGNKWRKLRLLLHDLQAQQVGGLITMGGPFSNHLHAVAAAGQAFGFQTVGLVRGLAADVDNPTLRSVRSAGMRLHTITKQDYNRLLDGHQMEAVQAILAQYPKDWWLLPEGGRHDLAVRGCMDIANELLAQTIDYQPLRRIILALPAGTGTTAAGIARAEWPHGLWIFAAAPYGVRLDSISTLAGRDLPAECRLVDQAGLGRFAELRPEVRAFAEEWAVATGFRLDPIYTAKMMFTLWQMLRSGEVPPDTDLIALHTGGLQGWGGFESIV
jgi:1-aminocyclopropane-1-carboxylate deaminase